jgi:hypothetical protein
LGPESIAILGDELDAVAFMHEPWQRLIARAVSRAVELVV